MGVEHELQKPREDTPHLVMLPHGAVLFKHWVCKQDQEMLLTEVHNLATEADAGWIQKAQSQEHPYIVCSYDRAPPGPRAKDCVRACGLRACIGACGRPTCTREPTSLYNLAQEAFMRGKQWINEQPDKGVTLPESFNPSTCWGLAYKGEDKMPAHLDRAEGWTLSVSVGATVDFVIGREPEKGSMYGEYAPHKPYPQQVEQGVAFESGDLLLFEGDRLFHGVDGIQKDTAPSIWNDSLLLNANNRLARVGLLFRDGH